MTTQFKSQVNWVETEPGMGVVTRVAEDFKITFGKDSVISDIRVMQLAGNELPILIKDIIEDATKSNHEHLILINEVSDIFMVNSICNIINSVELPKNLFIYIISYPKKII